MLRTLAFLAGLVCLPALAQQAGPSASLRAGRIELVEGEVAIVDATAKPQKAAVGEAVRQGDTIVTGKDGEIHLKLADGSILALRPDTRMTLTRFQDKGRAGDGSIVSLFRGALRTITGWLGRRKPDSVRVKTPTATIGIRGTDHETFVIAPGGEQGEAGTYDKVNAGGTRLRNDHGAVDVSPGQAGFAAAAAAPVVLPSVPAFFQPTANEGRLEGLNEALQRATTVPAPAAAEAPAGGRPSQPAGKGGVQLQGNTRINAVGRNTNAVAIGSDNEARNEIGTIGK